MTFPENKRSISWRRVKGPTGEDRLRIKWPRTDCRLCPTEYLCKHSRGEPKILGLALREQHESIQEVRTKQRSKSWKELYNLRAGVEATISQGVRSSWNEAFALPRYRQDPLADDGDSCGHQFAAPRRLVDRKWPGGHQSLSICSAKHGRLTSPTVNTRG